LIIKGLSIVW